MDRGKEACPKGRRSNTFEPLLAETLRSPLAVVSVCYHSFYMLKQSTIQLFSLTWIYAYVVRDLCKHRIAIPVISFSVAAQKLLFIYDPQSNRNRKMFISVSPVCTEKFLKPTETANVDAIFTCKTVGCIRITLAGH